jgi:predicted MFS family arabinose efflux permease
MGVFGQYGGGVLSQKSRLERNFLLITIIVFPTIFIMSFTTDFLLLALALLYFTFLFFLQPINNTLLARHTTAPMRGTAFGIYFFSAFAIGSLASSYSGFVAQTFGLQWVFLGLSGSALLLIFFALFLLKVKESIGPSHS